MSVTMALTYDIRSVAEVTRTEDGARIAFRDGSTGRLEASHSNFASLLWLVEWSLAGRPVGIVVDSSGQIIDLNAVHDTGVYWVREFPTDRNRFAVAFWAYSPICGLTRDHPEFERIHATLTDAVRSSQMVCVATHSVEVVEDEVDEHGLIAALPKIMDVRPGCFPASSALGPGSNQNGSG